MKTPTPVSSIKTVICDQNYWLVFFRVSSFHISIVLFLCVTEHSYQDKDFSSSIFSVFTDTTQEECIEIEVNGNNVWEWDDEDCLDKYRYICEVPRVSMNMHFGLLKTFN